jgi:4'-phosphopantetheinyl transferase
MRAGASLSDLTGTGKPVDNADAVFARVATTCAEAAVWQARLDIDPAEVLRCAALLSTDEQARAQHYRFERDRRRFVVARGRLRLLLGKHLAVRPDTIVFDYTSRGKPFVRNSPAPLYFNVAHTEDLALYAVSSSCPTGVDIEYMQREIDHDRLASRFFTRGEYRGLQQVPESRRKRAFLACWARKEAIVKAIGDGLALPLDQFEVSLDPDFEPRIIAASAPQIAACTLHAADVGTDYVAAVATFHGRMAVA